MKVQNLHDRHRETDDGSLLKTLFIDINKSEDLLPLYVL